MHTESIAAVGIDLDGSLWVQPTAAVFPHIYREAMGVHWDADRCRLYSPKPREWSYLMWFHRILDAAREQGVILKLDPSTIWSGVDQTLIHAIIRGDVKNI